MIWLNAKWIAVTLLALFIVVSTFLSGMSNSLAHAYDCSHGTKSPGEIKCTPNENPVHLQVSDNIIPEPKHHIESKIVRKDTDKINTIKDEIDRGAWLFSMIIDNPRIGHMWTPNEPFSIQIRDLALMQNMNEDGLLYATGIVDLSEYYIDPNVITQNHASFDSAVHSKYNLISKSFNNLIEYHSALNDIIQKIYTHGLSTEKINMKELSNELLYTVNALNTYKLVETDNILFYLDIYNDKLVKKNKFENDPYKSCYPAANYRRFVNNMLIGMSVRVNDIAEFLLDDNTVYRHGHDIVEEYRNEFMEDFDILFDMVEKGERGWGQNDLMIVYRYAINLISNYRYLLSLYNEALSDTIVKHISYESLDKTPKAYFHVFTIAILERDSLKIEKVHELMDQITSYLAETRE